MSVNCIEVRLYVFFFTFFGLVYCSSLQAQSTDSLPALGIRVGSLGWGVEYNIKIAQPFNTRIVWQILQPGRFELQSFDDTLISDDQPDGVVKSTFKANGHFQTLGIIGDWHPWDTPVRFSFGIFRNSSQFTVTDDLTAPGPQTYSTHFGQLGYFFGSGWSSRSERHKLKLTIDAGLLAQQQPQVSWINDGVAKTPSQQNEIWAHRQELRQELADYKVLPVLMIGLIYNL
mgnify:CR=1 FL=1